MAEIGLHFWQDFATQIAKSQPPSQQMANMWYQPARILMYIYGNMKLIPALAEAKVLLSRARMSISIVTTYQWLSLGLVLVIHGDYKMENKMDLDLTPILMRFRQPIIRLLQLMRPTARMVRDQHPVAPIAPFMEQLPVHPTVTSLIGFQQRTQRKNFF